MGLKERGEGYQPSSSPQGKYFDLYLLLKRSMKFNLENLYVDVGAERVNSFYPYNGDQRKTNLNKSNFVL